MQQNQFLGLSHLNRIKIVQCVRTGFTDKICCLLVRAETEEDPTARIGSHELSAGKGGLLLL